MNEDNSKLMKAVGVPVFPPMSTLACTHVSGMVQEQEEQEDEPNKPNKPDDK